MTELERLLTLQLQQGQLEAEQMRSEHQAEVKALQQQLSGLESAWEASASSYSDLFNAQQKSLETYKQQTESALQSELEGYKRQIEGAFQSLNKEVEQRAVESVHTLHKLENGITALTKQLNGLTRLLKG